MSHELRTPFSSFYGLLDILSGTELNAGQREIGTNFADRLLSRAY